MKKFVFKTLTVTAAFVVSATAFSASSFANESTVAPGSLTGGGITFSALNTTLDGTKKVPTADWAINDIIDARGTGAGWNLSLTMTAFQEVDSAGAYVSGGKTLANNSLKVATSPNPTQKDTTSSETTTITSVTGATSLDTGSAVKLLSAKLDGGMGSYTVSNLGVALTIPANAYAKSYKTTATVALNTAP